MLKRRKNCEGEVYNRGTKASTGFSVPPPFEMNFQPAARQPDGGRPDADLAVARESGKALNLHRENVGSAAKNRW